METTVEQAQKARTDRAIVIAAKKRITKKGAMWIVPSASHSGSYVVSPEDSSLSCTCPDFDARHAPCKHVIAVEIVRTRELPDGTKTTDVLRITYSQDWSAYNKAQTREKEHFGLLLRDLCAVLPRDDEKRGPGRPPMPLPDLVYGAATKVYSTQSGRRSQTDVREAVTKGLAKKAAHYNTISDGLRDPNLTPILKTLIELSATPLRQVEVDFAGDSTGLSTCNYQRYFDVKHGGETPKRQFVKLHAMCGVKTHIITACEVTSAGDATQLPSLLDTTAKNFRITEVSADRAYSSHQNVEKIVRMGAMPFIPFRDGTGLGKDSPESWKKLYHLYALRNQEFKKHYHKRSNVETSFSMLKGKFGASIRSKHPTAMTNEILLKVLCHDIVVLVHSIYELGLAPMFDHLEGGGS